jgi:glucose-1-phosphate cytidylyltransferase
VEKPFQRLIDEGKLFARYYKGFWRSVDTFKDLQALEGLLTTGSAPWQVWQHEATTANGSACQESAFT